jgi:hypothetical protein
MVNNALRESTLDHVYTNNPLNATTIEHLFPIFGDHCIITLKISHKKPEKAFTFRRDWSKYNKELVCKNLSTVDWSCYSNNLQSSLNNFENKILDVCDFR